MSYHGLALALVVAMSPIRAAAAPALSARYAAIFEPGRRWTYQVDRLDEVPVERAGATTWRSVPAPRRRVACEVVAVEAYRDLWWAQIACDDEVDPNGMTTPAGTWLADGRGLYRLADARGTALAIPLAFAGPPVVAAASGPRCATRDRRADPIGDGALDRACFRGGLDTVYFAYVGAFPYRAWLRRLRRR